jgi:hypothetical protein
MSLVIAHENMLEFFLPFKPPEYISTLSHESRVD